MNKKGNDKEKIIKYRINRANETIDEVQLLIDNNKNILAVSRIYYGCYYVLSALALKYSFDTSSHGKLIGWFNKEFIKSGKIDKKYGQFIHKAFDERSTSDYADFVEYTKNEVVTSFTGMKAFINEIENLI